MSLDDSLGLVNVLNETTDQGMNDGIERSVLELADIEFKKLVAAVIQSGKAGKLTLTLGVKSDGDRAIVISPDWKATLPPAKKVPFVGYGDVKGNVFMQNPAQLKLDTKTKMGAILPMSVTVKEA